MLHFDWSIFRLYGGFDPQKASRVAELLRAEAFHRAAEAVRTSKA